MSAERELSGRVIVSLSSGRVEKAAIRAILDCEAARQLPVDFGK